MRSKKPEHPAVRETGREGVMRACLDLLEAERIRHWRMNAGDRFGSHKGKKWRIRGHAKGTPDILAFVKRGTFCDIVPRIIWIECKAPGKFATNEQFQFKIAAEFNGEYWMLVDDPKTLQDWLKANKAR